MKKLVLGIVIGAVAVEIADVAYLLYKYPNSRTSREIRAQLKAVPIAFKRPESRSVEERLLLIQVDNRMF